MKKAKTKKNVPVKREKPLHLDMTFEEAIKLAATTPIKPLKKSRKKK